MASHPVAQRLPVGLSGARVRVGRWCQTIAGGPVIVPRTAAVAEVTEERAIGFIDRQRHLPPQPILVSGQSCLMTQIEYSARKLFRCSNGFGPAAAERLDMRASGLVIRHAKVQC